ncbi:MAG: Stealth CR1 domain-containing protein [Clostridia bacterium]|nr:Stealth CR1 domain-containing protein [Clostridia bacterium]
MAQSYPIDFVVLWVDGADPVWREKRAYWAAQVCGVQKTDADNGHAENRFRDWDLMRYWFRGAEKFAPWVNRIWFVTDGQRPVWLNTDHPKLRVISHAEYLPADCLPTFNSNAIELGLHRIPDLSEHFVLFNDDMFLCAPTAPEDFFRDGKPCDAALMDAVTAPDPGDCLPHMLINNFAVINRQFSKRQVLREHFGKFFHRSTARIVCAMCCLRRLRCFRHSATPTCPPHIPNAHLHAYGTRRRCS